MEGWTTRKAFPVGCSKERCSHPFCTCSHVLFCSLIALVTLPFLTWHVGPPSTGATAYISISDPALYWDMLV